MDFRRLWASTVGPLIHPQGTAAFLTVALVVGIVVGLAAAALIGSIEGIRIVTEHLGDSLGSRKAGILIALPAGFVCAWLIGRKLAPEVTGDGVPEATAALAVRAGYMRFRAAPLKLVATALTVGPGGSAGREGPIVQIGSAIASSFGRISGMGEDRVRSLVAAGAGAAIGASFNAPIAGMLFAMEVILGNFALRHLNAVVVASVAAAVTTRSIVGEERILRAVPHSLGDARELLLYAGLGLVAAAVAAVFLRMVDTTETIRFPFPDWFRPLLVGLVVAGLGWIEPDILGTGQDVVAGMLSLVTEADRAWWVLLSLAGLKVVATSLTLGGHGSGGAFMPSLFIGAALGAGLATMVAPYWTVSDLEPGAFAVVGMAATFAAVARAPLTSILIVFEITGDYGLVLPLMLAASLATFLGERLHGESVYTMALSRQGIRLTRRGEIDVLDTVLVGEVASPVKAVATPTMTTGEAQGVLDRHRHHGLPVVDDGRLIGVVTISDIMRTGGPSDQVLVRDAMTHRPFAVTPATPVSAALERMASLGIGRIPVVDDADATRLVGLFRRADAIAAYHRALGQEVAHEMGRERLRARITPGAGFFDIEIPAGSVADGRAVKEVPVPSGCTIVSVRRGTLVMVPDGNTRLRGGDVLVVFARSGSLEQFEERLRAADTAELFVDDAARFFDIEIPSGSVADGRLIKEIPIPGGCTIVSVRRGPEIIVPNGNTELHSGDVVTVFAAHGPHSQLAERLRATAAPG